MEHLLPPHTIAPIQAPCLPWNSKEPYDRADFKELYGKILTSQHKPDDVTPDHEQGQWWLDIIQKHGAISVCHMLTHDFFFGLLYNIIGKDVADEFMEKGEIEGLDMMFLSTRALGSCLEEFRSRVSEMGEDEKATRLLVAKVVLGQAATVLRHLGWFLNIIMGNRGDLDREPLFPVHFACVVLHQAMVEACGKILGLEVRAGNEFSMRSCLPYLLFKMQNWCPFTLWRFYTMGDVDEMVYAYWLGTKRTAQDHGRCTVSVCNANHMSEDAPPGHVLGGDCSECQIVDSPMSDMLEIYEGGGTPVLRLEKDGDRQTILAARMMKPDVPYVTLSHVWADGLGSSRSNSIRACQLDLLFDRITEMERDQGLEGELCVWIDTLCLPIKPDLSHIRSAQIQDMHEIYRGAHAVLIIDADFMDMKQDATIEEVGTRLNLSAWASRLWTYQEAALNKSLLIMTKLGFLVLEDTLKEYSDQRSDPDPLYNRLGSKMWSSASFTLGRLYSDVPSLTEQQAQDKNARDYHDTLLRLRCRGDRVAQMLLHSIHDRTASRPDDESIIIASCLGLQTGPILQAPSEERMMALIKVMPYPPGNMIFGAGRRLPFPGFRWAPTTFLRSKGGGGSNPPLDDLTPTSLEDIENNVVAVRRRCRLDENGRGLHTFNAGIRLPRPCYVGSGKLWEEMAFELLGKVFAIRGLDGDVNNNEANASQSRHIQKLLGEDKDLVVLLPKFDPSEKLYIGVLVEIMSDVLDNEEFRVNDIYELQAKFIMMVQFVHGDILDEATVAMGLGGGGEVGAFVRASEGWKGFWKAKNGGELDSENDDGESEGPDSGTSNNSEGSEGQEVEDTAAVSTTEDHEVPLTIDESAGTPERERFFASVIKKMTLEDRRERQNRHQAAWINAQYWLVD